ncbi:hypothetical protein GZ77_16335 [Endozoicomonas montiporae]|uniref:tRNA 5-methylaminomethyl-2-thiouridine biosynthesis bifunctional protein MnmC n=2 Tax=Endozoicomonas montiporae TaxID=1027273 RepID=A0A081N5W0_9GAMM|nr:bifunctional tRNA (5-methylaminomethyl-2-thiouridine)(34)-methyltransferase MnmD/FAD-dependent 5-carboxymethylaminomethyl-2-thiouridine(34) oxidoreductase MnmC [Endozoicomonas montiporae]AMO57259.1 5-methylaminomethyl-2-thiouridine methyltransferase [Endozoicomonas montiporae CL-33]KEQ13833.1 hypothetical protein GZ77_16335 [Endozoicomonas montiporae]
MSTSDNIKTTHARLEWRENGQPVSSQYNDIYFSTQSGVEETVHTFIKPNQLPERFTGLSTGECFTIAETGFGTGLSFLCAWQLFDDLAVNGARLHFISTEKHPLQRQDFQRALSLWPLLKKQTSELTGIYQPACQGQQHFVFAGGRVRLTLLIGEVQDTLPDLYGSVDAWFLDGFSPSKNPDMWSINLFEIMAQKSHEQTTFATFTAARMVRDGLTRSGFNVEKASGYGKKRDMLFGQFRHTTSLSSVRPEWQLPKATAVQQQHAVIIGGGLAGTSTARSLAQRGWQVTLLEQHPQLAAEASGNPQGIIYAKLSPHHTPLSRFILQGYLYSINLLNQLNDHQSPFWYQTGVIQFPTSEKELNRYQALAEQLPKDLLYMAGAEQIETLSGFSIHHEGLVFPEAGWVKPAEFCHSLSDHPAIKIKTGHNVSSLEKDDNEWILLNEQGKEIIRSEVVVVAAGTHCRKLSVLEHLPVKAIRGQITQLAQTDNSRRLSACLCSEGYIAPAAGNEHTLGATFDFNDSCQSVRSGDHQRNIAMLADRFPGVFSAFNENSSNPVITGGRTAFRCTTPDYLPLVGPVINRDAFLHTFAALQKNAKTLIDGKPEYLPGLYINTGHGSRGLVTAPLSGEVIASMICGDSNVVEYSLLEALNPTRFLIRDVIKGNVQVNGKSN